MNDSTTKSRRPPYHQSSDSSHMRRSRGEPGKWRRSSSCGLASVAAPEALLFLSSKPPRSTGLVCELTVDGRRGHVGACSTRLLTPGGAHGKRIPSSLYEVRWEGERIECLKQATLATVGQTVWFSILSKLAALTAGSETDDDGLGQADGHNRVLIACVWSRRFRRLITTCRALL